MYEDTGMSELGWIGAAKRNAASMGDGSHPGAVRLRDDDLGQSLVVSRYAWSGPEHSRHTFFT